MRSHARPHRILLLICCLNFKNIAPIWRGLRIAGSLSTSTLPNAADLPDSALSARPPTCLRPSARCRARPARSAVPLAVLSTYVLWACVALRCVALSFRWLFVSRLLSSSLGLVVLLPRRGLLFSCSIPCVIAPAFAFLDATMGDAADLSDSLLAWTDYLHEFVQVTHSVCAPLVWTSAASVAQSLGVSEPTVVENCVLRHAP